MSILKILASTVKIYFGDLKGCISRFRNREEPLTNGSRIASIISGSISGGIITTYIVPNIFSYLVNTFFGTTPTGLTAFSLELTDTSLGIILGSRLVDSIAINFLIPAYFYCKYGHSRELYRPFNNSEICQIHDAIAEERGTPNRIEDIRTNNANQGYDEFQLSDLVNGVLAGTEGLLKKIRSNVMSHRADLNSETEKLKLDFGLQLLRHGKISQLCRIPDNYVTRIVKELFHIQDRNGRYTIDVRLRNDQPEQNNSIIHNAVSSKEKRAFKNNLNHLLRTNSLFPQTQEEKDTSSHEDTLPTMKAMV